MGRYDSRDYPSARDDYDDGYSEERRAHDRYDDESRYTGAYGYTGEYETGYRERYSEEYSVRDRALIVRDESEYLPALVEDEESGPVVIPGSGVPMGEPQLALGHRSLTMRVAVVTLMAAILVSGLFAMSPIGSSADAYGTSFQALSGVVVLHSDVSYHIYIAQWNDTPESIAAKQRVQVGGIYKLNNLLAGQELTVGKAYKIPDDPKYGAGYRPPSLYSATADFTTTTYGPSMWASHAGVPPPEVPCGVDGHGTPTNYLLQPPNPGAYWVRGFTWFHNGVDLANPRGTPIRAAQAGEVIWAGWANDGFGNSVKINHCYHISTAYGHMDRLNVKVHQIVQPGDIIGFEGSTGNSTGPHLHYMVEYDNVPIDPMPYYGYSQSTIRGQAQ
jgi:murein DD-endopeptidase MepM/ murein hydrolase activator NlpD